MTASAKPLRPSAPAPFSLPFFAHVALALVLFLSAAGAARATHAIVWSAEEARAALAQDAVLMIDVRTPGEWKETGIAEGAVALTMHSRDFIQNLVTVLEKNPGKPVAFICATGVRSAQVAQFLTENGVPNIIDVSEGMLGSDAGPGWIARGFPLVPPPYE